MSESHFNGGDAVRKGGILPSTYRRHIQRSKSAGNYFLFFRPYFRIMRRIDALFIQDLINLAASPGAVTEEIDGREYFLCTSQFLEASPSEWNEEEQKRYLNSLLELKFIHIVRKGAPPRRWVHIDFEKLEGALDAVEGETASSDSVKTTPFEAVEIHRIDSVKTTRYIEKGSTSYSSNNGNKEKREEGRSRGPSPAAPPFRKKTPQEDQDAAEQLRQSARSQNRKVDGTPASSAEEFRILRTHDKQDYRATLDWYCSLSNEEIRRIGFPTVSHGKEFRKHWNWIHDKYLTIAARPAEEEIVPTPKAEELAEYVARELGKDADEGLASAVQRCLNFCDPLFTTKIPAAARRLDKGSDVRRFFEDLYEKGYQGSYSLILEFYKEESWRRKTPWIDADSKWLRDWGRGQAKRLRGDARLWDGLFAEAMSGD